MFLRSISTPINDFLKNKDDLAVKLKKLGIFSISDLITFYPRNWEDRSKIVPIKDYQNSYVCAPVRITARQFFGYGKTRGMKVFIEDYSSEDSGLQAVLMCFNLKNRPFLEKQLLIDSKIMIYGKFINKNGEIQCSSFDFSSIKSTKNFGKILPIYPLTAGLTLKNLRSVITDALNKYVINIKNELPKNIIEKNNLLSKSDAIKLLHYPNCTEDIKKAKETLIYEELFYLEVMVGKRVQERNKLKSFVDSKEKSSGLNKEMLPLQNKLLERLTFSLTEGQKKAIIEINNDIKSHIPMARLLQGDVGSGKTIVSFLAALLTVENGGQTVIMAPTELLARQLADNAAKFLEPLGLNIAFLTGNIKAKGRKELLKSLKNGEINIIVGTHALFSSDVEYKNLKLVIIDEQHRFGVTQRSLIVTKGKTPDLLMMSATPIPRSLALTVFGDMDVSVISDKPPGRKPVITHLAKESNEMKVYNFVKNELDNGRQAYFVYPLIDDGEELKDAVSMAQRLSKEIFPKYKTALIHSKLSEEEKKQTMDDFRCGKINILAATSVVEVGVDVPNATCMVIEHAERFGLSALHQLRGRVGRGKDQSYCFLIYSDEYTEEGKTRLMVMLNNNDGFVIAEEDLKMRGPGSFVGKEQSGFLTLGIADPIRDIDLLKKAREEVFSILENDPDLLLEDNRIINRVLEEAPPFSEVAL